MSPHFMVEASDIARLSAENLTNLLRMLLVREAVYEKTKTRIYVNPIITVPDGGIDGMINWDSVAPDSEFIPHSKCIYQCKAISSNPTRSILEGELLNEGLLKDAIKRRLEEGYHYCFVTFKKGGTTEDEPEAVGLMSEIAKSGGFDSGGKKIFHLFDAELLSNWCGKFPDVTMWVREQNSKNVLSGYQSYNGFLGYFSFQNEFFSNPEIDKHIKSISSSLSEAKKIVRVFGFSGLGKTRIILEALRSFSEEDLNKDSPYCMCIRSNALNLKELLEFIKSTRSDTRARLVLFVDDCDNETFKAIQDEITHKDNICYSFISSDYEVNKAVIASLNRSNIQALLINNEDTLSIIPKILSSEHRNFQLSQPQIEKVAEFCEGYPLMATLIADQLRAAPDCAGQISEPDLLNKILSPRARELDQEQLKIVSILSLFDPIHQPEREIGEQLKLIAKLAEIPGDQPEEKVYNVVKVLESRGIIDRRHDKIKVRPRPLAATLCKNLLEVQSNSRIADWLKEIGQFNYADAFCERFRHYQHTTHARILIERLCGPATNFFQAEILLSAKGSVYFRHFSVANPVACTNAISRIFQNITNDQILALDNDVRRDLVVGLSRCARESEIFFDAMNCLVRFADNETESFSNNSTGLLQEKFSYRYSGTEANYIQRIKFIRRLISTNICSIPLILKCLQAVISSHGGIHVIDQYGAFEEEKDYTPSTWGEVFEYWKSALRELLSLSQVSPEYRSEIFRIISESIRTLIRPDFEAEIDLIVDGSIQAGEKSRSQILQSLKDWEKYDNNSDENLLKKIRSWISKLEGVETSDRLKLLILGELRSFEKDSSGNYVDGIAVEINSLANDLSLTEIVALISYSFQPGMKRSGEFGFALGKRNADQEPITQAIESVLLSRKDTDFNHYLILGYLEGSKRNDVKYRWLEIFKESSARKKIPELLCACCFSIHDLELCIQFLSKKVFEIDDLLLYSFGRRLMRPEIERGEILKFLYDIIGVSSDYVDVAIHILDLNLYSEEWNHDELEFLYAAVAEYNLLDRYVLTNHLRFPYELDKIIVKALEFKNSSRAVQAILLKVESVLSSEDFKFYHAPAEFLQLINWLLIRHPSQSLSWISEFLAKSNDRVLYSISRLFGPSHGNDENVGILPSLDEEILLTWIEQNITSERFQYLIGATLPGFVHVEPRQSTNDDVPDREIHELSLKVLSKHASPQLLESYSSNIGSFSWVGGSSSYHLALWKAFEKIEPQSNEEFNIWCENMIKREKSWYEHDKKEEEMKWW